MTVITNRTVLAAAFDEWARRYEANPEAFRDVIGGETYGGDCAGYLIDLLKEIASA